MSGVPKDTPLGPLNDTFKFFVANMHFTTTPQEIKNFFSSFGTVNFVKVIQDNKTKQSRGYGFLYMYDAIGDAAVERFATEHQNRITLFGKTRVFLARHDYQRAVPLRDPNKASHDGNMPKAQPPPPPHHHQQQHHQHRRPHQHQQQHHHQQHQQYRGSNPNASYMPSAVAPQHEPSITHHHPHQAQGTQHSYQQQPNYYPAAPAPYASPPQQTYAPQQPVSYGHPPDTHVSTTYPPASNPSMQPAVPQTGGYAPPPPPQTGYNTSYPAAPNAAVHVPAAPPPQAPYSTVAQPHSTTVYHGQVDNSQYGAPVPAPYPPPPPAQYAVPAAAATPIPVVATAQQPQPYAPYQTPQPTTATPSAIPPPQPPAAHSLSTKIAIHHLPPETTPKDVVQLLSKLALSIRRCTMDYDGPHICFAHVDMTTTQDATRCITLAQQSQLRYKGRTLTASVDLHPPPDGKSIPVGMGAPVSSGPRPPPRRGGGGGGGGGGRGSGRGGGGRGRYRHRENRRNMNKPY